MQSTINWLNTLEVYPTENDIGSKILIYADEEICSGYLEDIWNSEHEVMELGIWHSNGEPYLLSDMNVKYWAFFPKIERII